MKKAQSVSKNSTLNIASTSSWIVGILNLLRGVVALSNNVNRLTETSVFVEAVIPFIVGTGLCIAGYRLRKRKIDGGILGIIFAIVTSFSMPFIGVGIILGILIIVFTAINWKELK